MADDLDDINTEQINTHDRLSSVEENHLYNDKARAEGLKRFFHIVTIASLSIVFLLAILLIMIRVYHFVAPDSWRWLSTEELQALDKTLFSGVIGGVLSKYMGKILGTGQSNSRE
jgi:hypothetical protein